MPFKSTKQRAFMYMKHPKIAEKWSKEFPNQKDLPKYAASGKKNLVKRRAR